ncbi:NUDIX hydrolase [Streptomyces europaeiscabiei]|uniref:NUDIX hydrolase n=1 Tax=Streptomyces TaxID=1883 RepID=UPI0015C50B92|nr:MULTISPECIES: NUDIX hydrolase [Streptomyces]MDX3634380.1 NUDIX hydrolase [Streptomyces europaeiscabiei]MDX3653464.1 NUDIX hydrolase [Streptomyces europaeiscabiei]
MSRPPEGAGQAAARYDPWEEISRSKVHEAYGRTVVEVTYRLPSGAVHVFSVRDDRPSVAVLALTTDGRTLVTRQFRPGPGRFMYELPGGYVDDGETPLAAAGRELLAETGYAGDLTLAGQCFSDSYSSSVKFCAVAVNCTFRRPPQPDDTEFIEVSKVLPGELRRLLRSGDATDVDLAYMGLDALGLL